MSDLERLAAATQSAFEEIHRRAFLGDPAANPKLKVEVVEAEMVGDTPTLILITPWTVNGLVFPPDGRRLAALVVGERRLPVFETTVEPIGTYQSVNLVPEVSGFASPSSAREAAQRVAGPFRAAVVRAREAQQVANPSRRDLFGRLGGQAPS